MDAVIDTEARAESGRAHAVPGLILADRIQGERQLEPHAPGVEVCYDAQGQLLAHCCQESGALRVDLPDLVSFSYELGADHVRAMPRRVLSPGFIFDVYHHCVLPLILPALGTEVLHASGVVGAAGVVAFCGPSGTGKSTIAVALARRGFAIWADDAIAVDPTGPEPTAVPLPFTVRLRPESARLLGDLADVGIRNATTSAGLPASPLEALCMLRRMPEATAPVAVERLGAAVACQAALAHAYCFSVKDPTLRRRTIRNYLTITAQVPAYEIRFRPGPECLSTVLDALEGIIGRVAIGKA